MLVDLTRVGMAPRVTHRFAVAIVTDTMADDLTSIVLVVHSALADSKARNSRGAEAHPRCPGP